MTTLDPWKHCHAPPPSFWQTHAISDNLSLPHHPPPLIKTPPTLAYCALTSISSSELTKKSPGHPRRTRAQGISAFILRVSNAARLEFYRRFGCSSALGHSPHGGNECPPVLCTVAHLSATPKYPLAPRGTLCKERPLPHSVRAIGPFAFQAIVTAFFVPGLRCAVLDCR